jgi:hypothetical protein
MTSMPLRAALTCAMKDEKRMSYYFADTAARLCIMVSRKDFIHYGICQLCLNAQIEKKTFWSYWCIHNFALNNAFVQKI